MLLTWITSNQARASCVLIKFWISSVSPSIFLFLCHMRSLQHPRRKVAGRCHHFQRQWVSSSPGHSGLCSGPRWRPTAGCAVAYRTSKYTMVSVSLLKSFPHTSSLVQSPRNILARRSSTPQITRAKRLVATPRQRSVPWSSTQSPRFKELVVFGVCPPPRTSSWPHLHPVP